MIHILQFIKDAKLEKDDVFDLRTRLVTQILYNNMLSAPLDLRDIEAIVACIDATQLLLVFKSIKPKYERMWQLAGRPENAEQWLAVIKRQEVPSEYWDLYHAEVEFPAEIQELFLNALSPDVKCKPSPYPKLNDLL